MKKSGLTLLELVIVIIVIGVLASLALPRLFSVIEGSRAAEAIANIASIRSAFERCYLINNGSYEYCHLNNGGYTVDIEDPSNSAGAHFSYSATGYSGYPNSYWINARTVRSDSDICMSQGVGISTFGADMGNGFCLFDWTPNDGKVRWRGHGPYKNFVPKSE